MATLIAFGGLPGSGKSSIARELARQSGAFWLRIDSIEQAVLDSGIVSGSVDDAGYRAAYAVAEDNIRLGHDVIADAVNGWPETRDAWQGAAMRSGAQFIEVEIICSDLGEHRRRVETRNSEVPGLLLPDWQAVTSRDYQPWNRSHLTIDTAGRNVEDCVKQVRRGIASR